MKTYHILLILQLLSAYHASGQYNHLVVTHSGKGVTREFKNGQKISIYKDGYYYIHGKLNIIDSTRMAVGNDTVALSEIKNIRKFSPEKTITGAVLTGTGVAILVSGLGLFSEAKDDYNSSTILSAYAGVVESGVAFGSVVVGTGMTLGGVALMTRGKSYRKADQWKYYVE